MIYPAMTAYAIGKDLGMTDEEIIKGIAAYVPTAMRMEAWNVGDNITIYNDTYNANPQSMKAGLTTLSKSITSVKVAVLGDMLELGEVSDDLHLKLIPEIIANAPFCLICIGPNMKQVFDKLNEAVSFKTLFFNSVDEINYDNLKEIINGKVVLIKASHSMNFSSIIDKLK